MADNDNAEAAGRGSNVQYKMNGETVWVIEDGQAFTLLYPLDVRVCLMMRS